MPNYANGFVTADGTTYQIIPPAAQSSQFGGVTADGTTAGIVYVEAVMGAGGKIYIPVANNTDTTEAGFAADARALNALEQGLSTDSIVHVGPYATKEDPTLELPSSPLGANARMTFTFSLPAGATLVGMFTGVSNTLASIVASGIVTSTNTASIRAYNLNPSLGAITWSAVYARPLYVLQGGS